MLKVRVTIEVSPNMAAVVLCGHHLREQSFPSKRSTILSVIKEFLEDGGTPESEDVAFFREDHSLLFKKALAHLEIHLPELFE